MTKTPYKPLTHEQLDQFTGDIIRFRHGLNPHVIYTPGVRFLAEKAGAYWLLDVIASYLWPRHINEAARKDERIRHLHFWRLDVAPDESAVVTARADFGCPPFVTQEIPSTDFPLEFVSIWAGYYDARWTLYLPSEH
jgi:hypothetical protein